MCTHDTTILRRTVGVLLALFVRAMSASFFVEAANHDFRLIMEAHMTFGWVNRFFVTERIEWACRAAIIITRVQHRCELVSFLRAILTDALLTRIGIKLAWITVAGCD